MQHNFLQQEKGKKLRRDKYKTQGWEQWVASWAGESLICPGCSEPYQNPHTGLLRDGAIIK